jgi:hypothetical protein
MIMELCTIFNRVDIIESEIIFQENYKHFEILFHLEKALSK